MLRVSEFSDTEVSFQTASSNSSFVMALWGLFNRTSRTRNAFGSTANDSPFRTTLSSLSRTSMSAKLKIRHLCLVIKHQHPHHGPYLLVRGKFTDKTQVSPFRSKYYWKFSAIVMELCQ